MIGGYRVDPHNRRKGENIMEMEEEGFFYRNVSVREHAHVL